jgi:4-hydroxy-tetrahydrodipicolinate synthase
VLPVDSLDLAAVFAVPPLPRREDRLRSLDFAAAERLRDAIADGGVRSFLYGGNAFLYHITLDEYGDLLHWMAAAPDGLCMIPAIGPSFGRAIDQAGLVHRHAFPCAMLLPCTDPRDADGLERGAREIAERSGVPLMLYLKDRANWGADESRGLDAVGRLVDSGVAIAIKYAVVRPDPRHDDYLDSLLSRVDRGRVLSGIGERPAVVHLEHWNLTGFTTGSGCLAPTLTAALLAACRKGDFELARDLREHFLPLEDLRDAWGPARVLHAAVPLAGGVPTGPIPPYVSALDTAQLARLAPVAQALSAANAAFAQGARRERL